MRLVQRAPLLFEKQVPAEKRQLLNFLLSNCVWKDGAVTAAYRQPFDLLAVVHEEAKALQGKRGAKKAKTENWLPTLDTFRTFRGQLAL